MRTLQSRTHSLTIARATPAKRALPFYLKPEWRSLMHRLIFERGRQCENCGASGCRIYGDHIIELQDGGAELDPSNVKLLCATCHGRKTATAARERMRR